MAFDIQLRDNGAGTFDISLFTAGGGPTYFGILKRWNGSTWVKAKLMRYNGSTWVAATLKRWNGSAWVEVDATGV